MRRRTVPWTWENPDAQAAFAEWVGFADPPRVAQEVTQIEALLSLTPPLDILDVGCGPGRHAIEMARRGYRVVGIDVAVRFLEEARMEAQSHRLRVEFRVQRGSELSEEGRYDAALALAHTLGFMGDEELRRHFACIRGALRPGGRFLLTLAGPKLAPTPARSDPVKNWAERDGRFILSEKRFEDAWRVEHCIVIDTQVEEIVEYHERQRAFTLDQVALLLRGAGFGSVESFADLVATPATREQFGVFRCSSKP